MEASSLTERSHQSSGPRDRKKRHILCPERETISRDDCAGEPGRGALFLDKKVADDNLEKVYALFPVLKKDPLKLQGPCPAASAPCYHRPVAMSEPKILLIDEPSLVAPLIKDSLFERIRDVQGMGVTILLTEQDVSFAFDLASRNM